MENQSIDAGFSNAGMITTEIQDNLRVAGKWGRFLAILGFIGFGLMILGSISMMTLLSQVDYPGTNASMGLIGLVYIVMAVLYFFPTLFLLRLSNAALRTGQNGNEADLVEMSLNLKKLFRYMGVVAIVIISIYVLIILFSLIMVATH